MSEFGFEWDEQKSVRNQQKQGVTFEEAATVFYDEHALFMAAPEHSDHEDRFVLLGLSGTLRTLIVCHCYRDADVVRIISARKATRRERVTYNQRYPG
jgi:uncharacterized DUF497 family protein